MSRTALIVVTGLPCTGKTTVGRRIAREFSLPYVGKDEIKERLFDTLGWSDRKWSRKLSFGSVELLFYVVEKLLAAGSSLVVDSNFKPEHDVQRFLELGRSCDFTPLVIHCRTEGRILVERFKKRSLSGERHPGHVDTLNWREFEPILLKGDQQPLEIGGDIIEVDTTDLDAVDYGLIFRAIRGAAPFLSPSPPTS